MREQSKSLGFIGFPMYVIDTNGNIYSKFSNKYLKPNSCSKYRQVTLYNGVGNKTFLLHRLVAQAFIPNPNNYDTVDHIDFNKNNNHMSNLRWLPKPVNSMRSWNENNHDNQKQPVLQLDIDGCTIHRFKSIQDAANSIGCDRSNISRACSTGRICKGYRWEFE